MKLETNNSMRSKHAFTLVELLLVIAIIAILASLGVGVMAQAQQDAAVASTRTRMNLIQKILEVELEDYEVRRSPIAFADLAALVSGSSLTDPGDRLFVHMRNLKRMIIADLIRAEMPDGSRPGTNNIVAGTFPTPTLQAYLTSIGITDYSSFNVSPLVVQWATDGPTRLDLTDSDRTDQIDLEAADKSELLHQILLNIDVDGLPALDQLGSNAIGDSDADGIPEILDPWGEPLYLQWQQEWLELAGSIADNIWNDGAGMAGLSREHSGLAFPNADYCKPVLPTQIRPYLVSERMLRVDGLPTDYLTDHTF